MKPRIRTLLFAPALPALLALNAPQSTAVAQTAIVTNISVTAWGNDNEGQTNVPLYLSDVTAAAVGGSQSLAVQGNGTVVAWGWNYYGQTTVPSGLSNVTAVAAGYAHSLALQSGGTVVAWGDNTYGQTSVPASLDNVAAVAAGGYHSLAVRSNETVAAWGYNAFGETSIPSSLNNVTAVAAGGYHSLALKNNGTVVAWGDNSHSQTNVPPGLSTVAAIAAGGYHSLALLSNGTVVAWGDNTHLQTNVPSGLNNVAAVAAGFYYSLALKSNGTVVAWGDDTYGQTNVPSGLNNVVGLASGALATHDLVLQKQAVSLPVLTATQTNGNVVISWPSPSTGWTLVQSSNLVTATWATNGNAITDNGITRSITIPSPTGSLFYQLTSTVQPPGIVPATYYVATNGNDTWSATLPAPNSNNTDGPFATFDHARTAVRSLNKTGLSQVTVQFRAGTYFLPATELFTGSDSGTTNTPIIYENYPGEAPVISGGKVITGWTQSGTISGAWQASVSGFAPFEQLWVNGQRRYRVAPTVSSSSKYLYNAGPVYVDCDCGCTNTNYASGYSPATEVTSGTYSGEYECFDRVFITNGDINPNYSGFADPNHPIELIDFEDWTIARMRLQSVGPSTGISGAPANSSVAYLVGATVEGDYWGFLAGHRYLVDNVQDVLSSSTPGQWYVTLTASGEPSVITYVPVAGEDFISAPPTVIAPQVNQLILGSGGSTGLRCLTFKGLTFSHANWVAGNPGYTSYDGGENEKPGVVPAALSFTNASHITLDSDVISQVGGWGAEFVGHDPQFTTPAGFCTCELETNCNNQIINCALTDLGAGGIRLGGQAQASDTDANVDQYDLIYNNVIAGGTRMVVGIGINVANAHNDTIDHNDIYDFYNQGINLGDSLNFNGNGLPNWVHDDLITYNHIYDLGQGVTSDMGTVHCAVGLSLGDVIANNNFHDITHDPGPSGYGGWAIYPDQGSSFLTITNNLVYNTSATGVHYNHSEKGTYSLDGVPNVIQNNIFAFGAESTINRNGNDGALNFTFANNIVYWDETLSPGGNPPSPQDGTWSGSSSTEFTNEFEFATNMYYSTVDPNMTTWKFQTSGGKYTLAGWQATPYPAEDFGSTVNVNPLFVNPTGTSTATSPAYNFNLQSGSTAPSLIRFHPFNANLAGRASPAFMPPALPPGLPLQPLAKF